MFLTILYEIAHPFNILADYLHSVLKKKIGSELRQK